MNEALNIALSIALDAALDVAMTVAPNEDCIVQSNALLEIQLTLPGNWCDQQESNLYLSLRRTLFYPLNYGHKPAAVVLYRLCAPGKSRVGRDCGPGASQRCYRSGTKETDTYIFVV